MPKSLWQLQQERSLLAGAYGMSPLDPRYEEVSRQQEQEWFRQNGGAGRLIGDDKFTKGGTFAPTPYGRFGTTYSGFGPRADAYGQQMTQEQIDAQTSGGQAQAGRSQSTGAPTPMPRPTGETPAAPQTPTPEGGQPLAPYTGRSPQQIARDNAAKAQQGGIGGNRSEIDRLRGLMNSQNNPGNADKQRTRIQFLQRQNQNTRLADSNPRFGDRADELNQVQDRLSSFKNPNNDPKLSARQKNMQERVQFLSRMQNNTRRGANNPRR